MNFRKRLIAIVTFLAGLYFILEFIVPPTVPLLTITGVALSKRLPEFRLETADGQQAQVQADNSTSFYVLRRSPAGVFEPKSQKSREIIQGETVTIRTRTITLGGFAPNGDRLDASGAPIVLKTGEVPYTTDGADTSQVTWSFEKMMGRVGRNGEANLQALSEGEAVNIEMRNAKVSGVDRGEIVLKMNGDSKTVPITNASVIMRNKRRSQPEETEMHGVQVGDTISIGPNTWLRDQRDTAAQFYAVVGTLALGMGLISLGMVNFRKIKKKDNEWYTAILFFVAIVIGVFAGLGKYELSGTSMRSFSDIIVLQVINAMGSSIFSILAFYLASAAYRAFRIRTAEAALMMATALIVMLGQTPFGTYLTGWLSGSFECLQLPSLAGWILRIPSSAFVRALQFGAMLGAIATALRYWLNLERVAGMGDD